MFKVSFCKVTVYAVGIFCVACNNPIRFIDQYRSLSIRQVQFTIVSPYSCYNKILIDSNGVGISIFGYQNLKKSDTLVSKKKFVIGSRKDKQMVNDIMDTVYGRLPIKSSIMDDGYHFTLIIDGVKCIDRYGQDSLINKFLDVLTPYVQNENNGQCDFFNLYKQITINKR